MLHEVLLRKHNHLTVMLQTFFHLYFLYSHKRAIGEQRDNFTEI